MRHSHEPAFVDGAMHACMHACKSGLLEVVLYLSCLLSSAVILQLAVPTLCSLKCDTTFAAVCLSDTTKQLACSQHSTGSSHALQMGHFCSAFRTRAAVFTLQTPQNTSMVYVAFVSPEGQSITLVSQHTGPHELSVAQMCALVAFQTICRHRHTMLH